MQALHSVLTANQQIQTDTRSPIDCNKIVSFQVSCKRNIKIVSSDRQKRCFGSFLSSLHTSMAGHVRRTITRTNQSQLDFVAQFFPIIAEIIGDKIQSRFRRIIWHQERKNVVECVSHRLCIASQ
ncbi:unnamed protein product [Kuraishia capsulata CBS 1993]|uniref:Uncharacterized protein n=1 Tax=Kuraishia capsulata CBS 1993 TaxID=1382522 RepID=W6MJH7_9ASCO|nr:uncharacterized protein KUCA_T00002398001 [Kuraishia capsulata CBS 1993]CDK26426.1 unnamed protein product [Kuraishia capsulata CBS 1993]